jgi:hypothetical protein
VLLVVEQLDPATVNAIVTNPAAISAAAANTVSAIQSMGLDGVDVDLEGTSQGYPNARSGMVAFMAQVSQSVRQSLPSAEILIDTYTGSAGCDSCFFDIPDIAPTSTPSTSWPTTWPRATLLARPARTRP